MTSIIDQGIFHTLMMIAKLVGLGKHLVTRVLIIPAFEMAQVTTGKNFNFFRCGLLAGH
jgi:hypothetical protein